MKFLNHLDLVENEARRLKMYRVAAGSYTPSVTTSGNIIMDTAAAIPKWWDGSAWRDFSYGTTGTMNWNIQSDSGSNIQVDQGDTLDLTGGEAMGTVTTGSATAPIVTFNVKTYGVMSGSTAGARAGDATTKIYGVERHPTTDKLQVHVPWDDNTTVANTFRTVTVDTNGNGTANNTLLQSETLMFKKGTNITLTEASGVVTISSTNTQYSALTNTVLGLAKTRHAAINNTTPQSLTDFTTRTYGVQKDSSDRLVVDVPWVNTTPPSSIVNSVTTTDGTYIDLTPNSATNGAVTVTADLSAVDGTPIESERVLSKSNKWITVGSIQGVDVDVSNANLLTRLAALESSGGAANENIVIGADAGDTIVITGNLRVAGTTTQVDSNTVNIADSVITLNADEAGTPSQNAGIEIERGTSTNVEMFWAENLDTWYVDESSTNQNGGGLAAKKVIQEIWKGVSADSGTAAHVANTTDNTLSILGSNGITTSATGQAVTVSGSGLATGTVMTLSASSIGSATNKRANVTHALGTKDVIVRTYLIAGEGGTLEEIYTNVTVMSTTVVSITFSAQPSSNVRVVVTAVRTPIAGTSVAYA
tara:strand:- start:104 stop:1873 length:1770 start_codon:yes stop_codon:yes gene_type:complete